MTGLADTLAAYRTAEAALDQARADLYAAIRAEHEAGASAYRIAQVTGLAARHVGRIVKG